MTSDEIVDLVSYLERGTKMLEIGGGHSTIFLSRLVKKLVTIEHNLEWSKTIENNMKNSNADWILHVVEPNWAQTHPFQPAEPGQFENYVNFISTLDDNQFDVILVDGRDRVRCSLQSINKLKREGILLIHDFWNREKYHTLLQNNELDLILDSNSYGKIQNNTLVAFKKK